MSQISSVGASGVGLRGIRERIKDFGGDLEVTSGGDGKGTAVRMAIPLTAATEATRLEAFVAATSKGQVSMWCGLGSVLWSLATRESWSRTIRNWCEDGCARR